MSQINNNNEKQVQVIKAFQELSQDFYGSQVPTDQLINN